MLHRMAVLAQLLLELAGPLSRVILTATAPTVTLPWKRSVSPSGVTLRELVVYSAVRISVQLTTCLLPCMVFNMYLL